MVNRLGNQDSLAEKSLRNVGVGALDTETPQGYVASGGSPPFPQAVSATKQRIARPKTPKNCKTCDILFTPFRKTAIYCSQRCKDNGSAHAVARKAVLDRDHGQCTYTYPDRRICNKTSDSMNVRQLFAFSDLVTPAGKSELQKSVIGRQFLEQRATFCRDHLPREDRTRSWARSRQGTFDLALEAMMPGPPEVHMGDVRDGFLVVSYDENHDTCWENEDRSESDALICAAEKSQVDYSGPTDFGSHIYRGGVYSARAAYRWNIESSREATSILDFKGSPSR